MNLVQQMQALLKSIFQWWATISPWEQGVRVRAGKRVSLLGPGIHLRIPLLDVFYIQPIRVRAQFIQSQTLTTIDGKAISLASALQFEIKDLLVLYRTVHNAHDAVEQKVQGAIAKYISRIKLTDIDVKSLESFVEESLRLDDFGLKVNSFSITNFIVVKPYRFVSGEMGGYTGYDQRLETNSQHNDTRPQ